MTTLVRRTALAPRQAATGYPGAVLTDNPGLFWLAEETSGTNADDATANNRDGTYTGTYTLSHTQLVTGRANVVSLGGGYINRNDSDGFGEMTGGSGDKLTLEVSIKPTSVSTANQMIVAKYQIWDMRIMSDGSLYFGVNRSGASAVMECQTAASIISAGTVHHVMGVFNRSTPRIEIFLDGTSVASSTSATSDTAGTGQPIQLGRRSDGGGSTFGGPIGYAAIWDGTALSSSQVTTHYNAWVTGG